MSAHNSETKTSFQSESITAVSLSQDQRKLGLYQSIYIGQLRWPIYILCLYKVRQVGLTIMAEANRRRYMSSHRVVAQIQHISSVIISNKNKNKQNFYKFPEIPEGNSAHTDSRPW